MGDHQREAAGARISERWIPEAENKPVLFKKKIKNTIQQHMANNHSRNVFTDAGRNSNEFGKNRK